jgi:DNA-binding IclR family transcriptional regulator
MPLVNSVLKAIHILNLFNDTESRLSLAEISGRLDMPKSTTHNLLKTLSRVGFIEQVENDAYALGTGMLPTTQNIRVNVEIRDPAAPLLRELADRTRESVYLTVRDGNQALYIYAVESPKRLLARTAVGDRVSLHCTSVGKAILAFLPDEEIEQIISSEGLEPYTENTIVDKDELLKELGETRARGYSIDNAEHEDNTYCVGAPIMNRKGEVIASCSVSGQDISIVRDKLESLAAEAIYIAQEISRRMGYVPQKTRAIASQPISKT